MELRLFTCAFFGLNAEDLMLMGLCLACALQAGVVESQPFTDAFFGLYMGTDPVSQDGRTSIARGLASLVAQP